MTDLIGQQLGQYDVTEQIAKGGMATVYKARQTSMRRNVAIKVLPAALTHDDTFLERFYREVEVIANLQHPHILPVYDFGEFDGMPYIVMAFLGGGTLSDIMKEGPMPLELVSRLVSQMADALDYAHSKGIIHRDFKPGNVLLDEQGNTYLADFGLAKNSESSVAITGTAILGTPTYMAPEQAESAVLTPAADVYALGITVFQMISGRVPYDAPTPLAALMAHATQPIPDIRRFRAEVPERVQFVIANAMAKSPDARYPTPGELAAELSEAITGGGSSKTITSEFSPEVVGGMLMTNMLGQVIFLDHNCLKMLKRHHHEARNIIGKPLHDVLGFNKSVTDQLMAEIGKKGEIDNKELQIRNTSGETLPVTCKAVATRDDKGQFVGADISLRLTDTAPPVAPDFDTMQTHLDSMQESYLQDYFTEQLEGLREYLVQMGGPRLGKNLEAIINDTAERNVWPVNMVGGQITVELKNTDADIYRALLAKAVHYAAGVMGKKPVAKQIQYIDKKFDASMLEFVRQIGITDLFRDLQ